MITKTLSLLLLLCTSISLAQIPNSAISIEDKSFNDFFFNKENIPSVKGKILNLTKEDIDTLTIEYHLVTPFHQKQVSKLTQLEADGTFKLEFDYAFPYQQAWLVVGDLYYAAIYSHQDLLIELDAAVLKAEGGVNYQGPGIEYLGTDGVLNTYMNKHILFEKEKQLALSKSVRAIKRDRKLNFDQFLIKYDSIYSIINELDNHFFKQNPSEFSWLIKNERQSAYFTIPFVKLRADKMKADLFAKVKKHKPYLTSNDGMQFYYVLHNYLRIQSAIDHPMDSTVVEKTNRLIAGLDNLFDQPKADYLKIRITNKDPNVRKTQLQTVLVNIKTPWCEKVIQEQYDLTREKITDINNTLAQSKTLETNNALGEAIEETSFGAKLYHIKSMDAQTFLSNLKNAFSEKALVVDFWATWCGPCLQEMPHSRKLHQKTKEMPVEFVYLCTSSGSDIEKWKTKITEYKLGGTHIFVDRKVMKELMRMFSFTGFPSYAFINQKGEYQPGAIDWISSINKKQLGKLLKE